MNKIFLKSKVRITIKNDVKFFKRVLSIPLSFIIPIILICIIGLFMMFSAGNGEISPWASKQIFHIFLSLLIFMIVATIDTKFYYKIAYFCYFFSLFLLIIVEFFGYTAMGATRWINVFFFKIQPADFMKISIILALARYYHDLPFKKIPNIRSLLFPLVLILLPIILIIKQPDLGTAMLLLFLSGGILFVAGVRAWKFIFTICIVCAIAPVIWQNLHTYQKNRILIFLQPELDPLGAGYNISQSKIAIGSAGVFGKGFMNGSQSQLNFLPERHTDFIFTMYSEEWGLIGSIILILLYSYIIYKSMLISVNCKHHFGRILSMGAVLLLFIHVVVNIGMVMGLLPVVGVPLPLMSYGGTIMISIFIAFGLIANSYIYKKMSINRAIKTIF